METLERLKAALADRYTFERELGRGGMATVYLAQDLRHARPVALKVLRAELAPNLGPERFLLEIKLTARLEHPHIIPVLDSGEAAGHLWYTMPYVRGESLRDRLRRQVQLPVDSAVELTCQIASALDYAHREGVVHRDLKPENILLSDGQARVADFGVAKALQEAAGETLTETGLTLGTPAYMSPEQATGGQVDARSDVYSLGCVLYEMLAGAPPFTAPTAQGLMARHAVDPVPPLGTVRSTVPVAVERAILRALAKVPADRFGSADEFAKALVLEDVPVAARRRRFAAGYGRVLLGAAIVVAAGLSGRILRSLKAPAVVSSAATIAVLPLISASGDTALIGLGRDLAVTISASLEGVGGVKTADRLDIAIATVDQSHLSAADGAALARRLGASSMVRGTLVGAGMSVRLDVGLYSTDGLAPLAEGITVTGRSDSIGVLTDSIVRKLLQQVWLRGDPPSPSLEAVTTRSLPALRAFLQGERELGANRWDEAILAYRSAIAADSTFWLAYFRYALGRFWLKAPVEPEVLAALRLHQEVLPERERLLVDAFLTDTDSISLGVRRYRLVTQRFPQFWPGWFLYADMLAHYGPFLGYDWSEGVGAFRRVVALNPKLVPAWQHAFALTNGRAPAEALRAWAHLRELGWPASSGTRLAYRLWSDVSQSGGVLRPELFVVADSLAKEVISSTDQSIRLAVFPLRLLEWGYPAAQIDLNRRGLRIAGSDRDLITALQAANAWSWAARGQWDSAIVMMSRLATASTGPLEGPAHPGPFAGVINSPSVESYMLAVLGAWLGATQPDLADQRRPAANALLGRIADEEAREEVQSKIAWLDGLLGLVRGDRRAIQVARQEVTGSRSPQAHLIDRSLAAFDRALQGDWNGAGRDLLSLEEYWAERTGTPIADAAVQRLAAAEWLRKAGKKEKALRLLGWHEAMQSGWWWTSSDALSGPGYLARAQLEEERGDTGLAEEYYRLFLRRYDQPTSTLAHLVEKARVALEQLQRDR